MRTLLGVVQALPAVQPVPTSQISCHILLLWPAETFGKGHTCQWISCLQGTSIFLIGMMGSGKSTVGRMLSNVLKYCFFDSDTVIEQAVGGASVADIFRENGEESFRDMEQSVLQELCTCRNCVIATGGGVVCRCALSFGWC